MNFADFILLIAVLLLVLFLLLRPKRKSRALTSSGTSASPKPSHTKPSHTKQAPTQSKVDLEALAKDRDATLSSFRSEIPPFILKEKLAFERQYSANPSKAFFGQEMSPLVCFGYRVGRTNGRPAHERHAILKYALAADLDKALPFLPSRYRQDWGQPLTTARYVRMLDHLNGMADLRDRRANFEAAVDDWRLDASWLRTELYPIVIKYRYVK